MPDEPQTLADVLRKAFRQQLWTGARRWWTSAFVVGAALLAVDYFGLGFGKDDGPTPLALGLFWVCVVCVTVGVLGHQITDLIEERRDKCAAGSRFRRMRIGRAWLNRHKPR